MFSLFCIAEVVEFPQTQNRKFDTVCANHEYYEKILFPWESAWDYSVDDSTDGIDVSGLHVSDANNESCKNNLQVSEGIRTRSIDIFNRIRWLTGYQRNQTYITDDESKACQCSFVSFANNGASGHSGEGRCTAENPDAATYCGKSNLATFQHKKLANGIVNLYNEGTVTLGHRQIILSPMMKGTTVCSAYGDRKQTTTTIGGTEYTTTQPASDFYTMGITYDTENTEELPFIAAPPPGFVPYYLIPRIFSFQSKDITNPQLSDIKVYRNGTRLTAGGYSSVIQNNYATQGTYAGYIFIPTEKIQETSFATSGTQLAKIFPYPGTVFSFEITNNGKTYRYNTTVVDCRQPNTYPDPPEIETSPTNTEENETQNSTNTNTPTTDGNETNSTNTNTPTTDGNETNSTNTNTSTTDGNETNSTNTNTPTTDGNGDSKNNTTTTTTASPESSNPQKGDNNGDNQSSGLTKGQKAGISIGVILGVAVIVGVVVAILFVKGVIGAGGAAAAGDAAADEAVDV
ncbi:hypothetical protein TVAG_166750 [Trichomonas vaginalis G3]|uniref:Uncharacterized protein n=1 Tax=Trichomonas vaginalis (strain ATCC PRA-98 / G3) TaxID=412133 RepID=A2DE82_TRIV3|nr:DNA-directed 5'-3' RNA polymerase protein [Trichomonas vaginalis G3]EAY21300.1 hypothetical protein TVAG_166750 [Trichomonas vaginalis G3]KAI5548962.1 DNA-directed 5'-3' RNA polymerase protein [Trichomonas vaginalis G3]|eukprot:XP_001582286.1 hypothetical protein [Trichomonas vaginalis G3]